MLTFKYKFSLTGLLKYAVLISVILISNQAFSQKKKKIVPPDAISTNLEGKGVKLSIELTKGEKHNHPMLAIWIEDENGMYLQTLYVNQSVAKGFFGHAQHSAGQWIPGELQRPASLPVWAHKRNILNEKGNYMPTPQNPVPDAYTGATPPQSFILKTQSDGTLPVKFKVFLEINQAWDWNEYWTNNKYPDDEEYKTSSQPSLIYVVEVDLKKPADQYQLTPIGTGHYSGKDGEIYPQLETLTTALQIVKEITLKLEK